LSVAVSIDARDTERSQVPIIGAVICVAMWAFAAISLPGLGPALFALGLLIPFLGARLLPLMLLCSFFFHSTMALPAEWLYVLRAYWVAMYLLHAMLTSKLSVQREVWVWFIAAAAVLVWGLMVGAFRVGDVTGVSRSPLIDGAATLFWLCCLLVGARFYADLTEEAIGHLFLAVIAVWIISLSYGVRQFLFGFSADTVPADIYAQVRGFVQYEVLGRRTFAFLSSNGITIISLLPICVLLSAYRHRTGLVVATLATAMGISALTLTRSFAALTILIVVGLRPVFRVSLPLWLSILMILCGVGAFAIAQIGLDSLLQILRFADLTDNTRAEIWGYTLQHFRSGNAWLGMGYGTAAWEQFFTQLYGTKVLQSPHSAVLEFAGQFGFVGLVFYAGVVVTVARWFLSDRNSGRALFLSAALALVLLREQVAATYVFSPNFFSGFFWLLFGMALAQHGASDTSGARRVYPVAAPGDRRVPSCW